MLSAPDLESFLDDSMLDLGLAVVFLIKMLWIFGVDGTFISFMSRLLYWLTARFFSERADLLPLCRLPWLF